MNAFGYKGKQAFPIYESKEKFEDEVNLSLMTDGKTSIMYWSKTSTCSCITKQNIDKENTFACTVCNVSAVRRYLADTKLTVSW